MKNYTVRIVRSLFYGFLWFVEYNGKPIIHGSERTELLARQAAMQWITDEE